MGRTGFYLFRIPNRLADQNATSAARGVGSALSKWCGPIRPPWYPSWNSSPGWISRLIKLKFCVGLWCIMDALICSNGDVMSMNIAVMAVISIFLIFTISACQIKLKFCSEQQVGSDLFKSWRHDIQYGRHVRPYWKWIFLLLSRTAHQIKLEPGYRIGSDCRLQVLTSRHPILPLWGYLKIVFRLLPNHFTYWGGILCGALGHFGGLGLFIWWHVNQYTIAAIFLKKIISQTSCQIKIQFCLEHQVTR